MDDGVGDDGCGAGSRIGGEEDKTKTIELKKGYALPHDSNVGAVVCGFDRYINYYKIQYAQVTAAVSLSSTAAKAQIHARAVNGCQNKAVMAGSCQTK
eukprot:1349076-Rhodomonas_salina.1